MRTITVILSTAVTATLAWSAPAVEVTSCGQVVPKGRAVLSGDLDCTSSSGAALTFERSGRLQLNGFSIRGGDIAVRCGSKCRIEGPGAIGDATICVDAVTGIRVTDAEIHGCDLGLSSGKVRADKVTVRDNFIGINAAGTPGKVRVADSDVIDNGTGIDSVKLAASGVTIEGNDVGVLNRKRAKLVGSSLDNASFDFRTSALPILVGTTCAGQSQEYPTGLTWGLCDGD